MFGDPNQSYPPSGGSLAGLLGAPPPAAAQPDQGGAPPPDPEELLQAMLDMALLYRTVEQDPTDRLKIEKATTLIQQILADRQGQHDQLLGGNAAAIRRLAG